MRRHHSHTRVRALGRCVGHREEFVGDGWLYSPAGRRVCPEWLALNTQPLSSIESNKACGLARCPIKMPREPARATATAVLEGPPRTDGGAAAAAGGDGGAGDGTGGKAVKPLNKMKLVGVSVVLLLPLVVMVRAASRR